MPGCVVMCHDSVDESDDDIDMSVTCRKDSVEDSIGEPEALTVDLDEASVYWAAVEACSHSRTMTQVSYWTMCHRTMVLCESHLGTVLAHVGRTVVVTCLGYAGHHHGHCGDC